MRRSRGNRFRTWKKALLALLIGVGGVFVLLWWRFGVVMWSSFVGVDFSQEGALPERVRVLPSQKNLRQTPYDCGAYNVYWLLRAQGQEVELSEVVAFTRQKMFSKLGVVPEVLIGALKQFGVRGELRTFRSLTPPEKINTLRTLMAEEAPLILLIHRHGYLHYVLLTGYEGERVFFYDPMIAGVGEETFDQNGDEPGNDAVSFASLIQMWDKVSVWGLYKNMAIVIPET